VAGPRGALKNPSGRLRRPRGSAIPERVEDGLSNRASTLAPWSSAKWPWISRDAMSHAIEPVRHRAERINFAAWHSTPSMAHSTFKVIGDQVGAAARPPEPDNQEDRPW
jgi:hypothetical protein